MQEPAVEQMGSRKADSPAKEQAGTLSVRIPKSLRKALEERRLEEEVTMDDLFPRLLTPPVDDGRYVVFPENVRLLGWTLEEGLLTVDLSTLEPTPSALLLLLLVGVVHTGIAYVLYFGSIAHVSAQTAALLSYIDPVVAVILSLTVLKEPMSPTAMLGAVLVIGAMIVSEIEPQKG